MRRYGEPPEANRNYRTRPGAYGIIYGDPGLLLTIEARPGFEAEVALPGGGVDPGESTLQALHRETMEETGWRISPERRLTTYQRYCYMPEYDLWARKVCHIYLCRAVQKHSEPTEEFHTAVWTDADVAIEVLSNSCDADVLTSHLYGL